MSRILRAVVRLYPVAVRARYGDEILDVVLARGRALRADRGRLAAARYWLFQLVDLARSGLRERRAAGGLPGVGLGQDVRVAARRIRRSPGFSAVVIVALAVGIGGTTAIFALVHTVLLKPLPYPEPGRLMYVGVASPETELMALTAGAVRTIDETGDVFAAFGAWSPGQVAVQWPDAPRQHRAVRMSAGVLDALGVTPARGRGFGTRDMRPGEPLVALLDHDFWQQRLSGADVLGRPLRLDGAEVTVIGVLPAEFRFLDTRAEIYLPLRLDDADAAVLSFDFRGIGRLPEGTSPAAAAQRITALLPASAERYGWIEAERLRAWGLRGSVGPLREAVVGGAGAFLWILLGSVGVVLVIACADVANLFLIRAQDRRQEVAARVALGASRGRVLRETLVESLLLTLLGGLAGTFVAYAGTRWLVTLAPGRLPRAAELTIDPSVLALTLGLCLLVACGLAILSILGRGESVTATLCHGERTASDSRLARRVRDTLAVAEIALALVLLVGSGLMIRSFEQLRAVEPGVAEPARVLTLSLAIPPSEVPDADATLALLRRIHERLAAVPGAGAVGAAVRAPTLGGNQTAVHTEDDPDAEAPVPVLRKGILGAYRQAAGIPLLAGRDLDWEDMLGRRPVGLVSEGLARALWGDPAAALGKRIRHLPGDAWREVVGVVGDVREQGLDRPAPMMAYWPAAVRDFHGFPEIIERRLTFTIRSERPDPLELLPAAREAVWAEAPTIPITESTTLDALLAASIERASFLLVALGLAAAIATALGAIGIYGVIAYVFARRGREIGIRIALGARGGNVSGLILRHAGRLAAAGLLIGVPAAVLSSRLLRGYLYGVQGTDPITYALAVGMVLAVAAAACVIPLRRALALDPVQALRSD